MTETRARRRIRKAVESRGYHLVSLEWEPWYDGGEMVGLCGGWYGEMDRSPHPNIHPGNDIMGLSVDETVAWVDAFVTPPEPCDCPTPDYPTPMQSQEPLWYHAVDCPWRLEYWLCWWAEQETPE